MFAGAWSSTLENSGDVSGKKVRRKADGKLKEGAG
jgi:hypothetical protein